jgi:hypothetical protein
LSEGFSLRGSQQVTRIAESIYAATENVARCESSFSRPLVNRPDSFGRLVRHFRLAAPWASCMPLQDIVQSAGDAENVLREKPHG